MQAGATPDAAAGIRLLEQRGGKRGYTALHFAVDRGHQQVVLELLARGAAVNAKSAPPSAAVRKSGSFPFFEWMQPDVVAGLTPLMIAVSNADLQMVELLVQSAC